MTWQGVQLPIVLVEILFEWGTKNFRFFAANLDKITKVRLRTKKNLESILSEIPILYPKFNSKKSMVINVYCKITHRV